MQDLSLIHISLHISHDAADPVAYRFKNENHAMAVVTDLGTYDDALVSKLQNLDGLLLEANHDINMLQTGAYPYPLKRRIMGDSGHLSNERSGQLLCELLHDKFGSVIPVSYTHLDVYKRQGLSWASLSERYFCQRMEICLLIQTTRR